MASFQDLLDHATKTGGPVSSNAGETDENIFFHNANHIKRNRPNYFYLTIH